jgi:hypothetical protein
MLSERWVSVPISVGERDGGEFGCEGVHRVVAVLRYRGVDVLDVAVVELSQSRREIGQG